MSANEVLNSRMLADYCRDVLLHADDPDSLILPEGRKWTTETLDLALAGKMTMFDIVVEFIRSVPERNDTRQITLTLE